MLPSLDEWLPQIIWLGSRPSASIPIWADLDLERILIYTSYAKTKGEPPDDPRLMLHVVAVLNGVRSSRKLVRPTTPGRLKRSSCRRWNCCRAAGMMVSSGRVGLGGTEVRAKRGPHKAMNDARLTEKHKVVAAEV
jgi:hypothetical protein